MKLHETSSTLVRSLQFKMELEYFHPATHLAVFLNFYSFHFFIPFKVVWDLNSSNYKIRNGSRLRKVYNLKILHFDQEKDLFANCEEYKNSPFF